MALGIISTVGPLLDGLNVVAGGHNVTFNYHPWGRHWDEVGDIISARNVDIESIPSNIGSGATQYVQEFDVHCWYEDNASMTDPEAFEEALVDGVETVIRNNEKTTEDSYYTNIRRVTTAHNRLGTGSTTLAYQTIITIVARGVETY